MDDSVHVLDGTPDSVTGRAGYTNPCRADQALRLAPQLRNKKQQLDFLRWLPSLVSHTE